MIPFCLKQITRKCVDPFMPKMGLVLKIWIFTLSIAYISVKYLMTLKLCGSSHIHVYIYSFQNNLVFLQSFEFTGKV